MFFHTKSKYSTWINFIACKLNGMTLEQEVVQIGKTRTTYFNMRHKLYASIGKDIRNYLLSGEVELDATYTNVNLKGTKRKNMPRKRFLRGAKSKTDKHDKRKRGISRHKVCMIIAIDEWDNILFEVCGTSTRPESIDKYSKYIDRYADQCLIIADSKSCIKTFAESNGFLIDTIPSIPYSPVHKTKLGHTLAEVNQLHSELKRILYDKHGVSIRHLQAYIDWMVFSKKLKYTIKAEARKMKAYMISMKGTIDFINKDICKFPLPIDIENLYH